MRRLLLGLIFALLLAAVPAQADTLTTSGAWSKASNWSEGRPTLGTPVVIPVGKEAVVKANGESGAILDEGRIAGPAGLKVGGSITVTHEATGAEWDLDGMLTLVGFSELRMGGEPVYYLNSEGLMRLGEPLEVLASIGSPEHSILQTQGYPLTVGYEMYPEQNTVTQFGTSTVTLTSWLAYPPRLASMQASEASFVIRGPGIGAFRGYEQTYGNVTLEGNEPASRTSYKVLGALALNRTTSGPIRVEAGTNVQAGALTTNATAEHPQRVEVVGAAYGETVGTEATIVCGCLPPAGLELVGVKVL